jgi:GGDEF domain-containing protein
LDSDSDIKTRITPLEDLRADKAEKGEDCLVVIYTSDARQFGKRHVLDDQGLSQGLSLGRGGENTVVLENDSVSRRHCKVVRKLRQWVVVDLESTNGTYVNDEQVKEYPLRRGDQVKVGDTILKFLSGSDVEAQYHETIYKMTIIDGLTGANNKRFLLESLEREIPRARRHQRPLSLTMLDIDFFKSVNDNYGHLAGDYVLKELANLIRSRLRPDDILARYGGEEFSIALPETGREGAARRLRGRDHPRHDLDGRRAARGPLGRPRLPEGRRRETLRSEALGPQPRLLLSASSSGRASRPLRPRHCVFLSRRLPAQRVVC